MTANHIHLQMKYARIINRFGELASITSEKALDFFYRSKQYKLISQGVSDMHCMSDEYLTENLLEEYQNGK